MQTSTSLFLRSEEMLEQISFLSCHAHSQLAVSWMKIWIAKETFVIGSRLQAPKPLLSHLSLMKSVCVYVCNYALTDAISYQNIVALPASIFFLYRKKSFDTLIMLFWKSIFWKINKRWSWSTYYFPPKGFLKGYLILFHPLLLICATFPVTLQFFIEVDRCVKVDLSKIFEKERKFISVHTSVCCLISKYYHWMPGVGYIVYYAVQCLHMCVCFHVQFIKMSEVSDIYIFHC